MTTCKYFFKLDPPWSEPLPSEDWQTPEHLVLPLTAKKQTKKCPILFSCFTQHMEDKHYSHIFPHAKNPNGILKTHQLFCAAFEALQSDSKLSYNLYRVKKKTPSFCFHLNII